MNGEQASRVLRHAERETRAQIAEAAAAGEYEYVDRLSSIARRLAEMAIELASAPGSPEPQLRQPPTNPAGASGSTPAVRAGRKASRGHDYPRFERIRDTLVKVGWSKKGREEYTHKVLKAGVDAVARRVIDLGKNGEVFTTEDLLPMTLNGGQDELPGYQTYVCLAWLRDIGSVERQGREGYVVRGDNVMQQVRKSWDALPISRR